MSKPFDVTTKQLVEAEPEAWIRYVGLPAAPTELIDADLATISTEADRVLRVLAASPYLAHIEFQSIYKLDLPTRTLRYNVLLFYRHGLPVQSIVILLRPAADGPAMTGIVEYTTSFGSLTFHYQIIRVWEQSAEALLGGELATLPLVPLANVDVQALPQMIRRMEARLRQEATPQQAATLWTATYILMGLKYSEAVSEELLKGVRDMEESVTYQAIIARGEARGRAEGEDKGKLEEARRLLQRLGRKRFGEIDAASESALHAISSLERLELLAERLLEVESWQELFA